jgi:hypothetical protein
VQEPVENDWQVTLDDLQQRYAASRAMVAGLSTVSPISNALNI